MDTDNFIGYTKSKYIYVEIAKDIEIRFNTSHYELDRHLPRVENKNWVD